MIEREFRLNDEVTCNNYGIGKVCNITKERVFVMFGDMIKIYYLDGTPNKYSKRTLFIIKTGKPSKEDVKKKFKQLLSEAKEVEFVNGKKNYYIEVYHDEENDRFEIIVNFFKTINLLSKKYIEYDDIKKISKEISNFIGGK